MRQRPTMIGCPACAGCLHLESGPHGHMRFLCSVGHTFSLRDVYESKETELERAEWSTIALLMHLQMILGMFLKSLDIPDAPDKSQIRQRLAQIKRQVTSVQELIDRTQVLARQGRNPISSEVRTKVRG